MAPETPGDTERSFYEATARHYDPAYAADRRLNDLAFWLELAGRHGGPILEVACGTGRVLLPIARSGVPIDGVDLSPEMLGVLKAKLAREPEEVRRRVALHEGDMRELHLGQAYGLVIAPFRSLQHLRTVDDQQRAFTSIARHVAPGGCFAFNVFYPDYRFLEELGTETQELEWTDPDDASLTVRRFYRRKAVDRLQQLIDGEFIFRSYRDGVLIHEERSGLRMSYYTYPHLQLLLRYSGLTIAEEYGSFAQEPIARCHEMIIIARKE
ncbi:MAG: class I SAM-dependent methyltransferase [Singulisphaera sp.]|nr:class I SAM-dependent methyltransferase [Singulisphaera sp.]